MNIIENIKNENTGFFIPQVKQFISDITAKITSIVRPIFEFAMSSALALAGTYHTMTKGYMTEPTANIVAITVGTIGLISLTIFILRSCKGNQKKNEFKKGLENEEKKETNTKTDNTNKIDLKTEEKIEQNAQDKKLFQENNVYEILKNLDDNIETISNRNQDFINKTNSIVREVEWSIKKIDNTKNKEIYNNLEHEKNTLSKLIENKTNKPEDIEKNIEENLKNFKKTLVTFKNEEKTKIDLSLKTEEEKKTDSQTLTEIKILKANLVIMRDNGATSMNKALTTNNELSKFLEKTNKITNQDINKHLDDIRTLHTSLSALIISVGPEGQITKTEKTAFKDILHKLNEILKKFTSNLKSKI